MMITVLVDWQNTGLEGPRRKERASESCCSNIEDERCGGAVPALPLLNTTGTRKCCGFTGTG